MKKIFFVFLLFIGALTSASATTKDYLFALPSLNEKDDSAAVLLMRHKMDSVRKCENRPTVAVVLAGGGAKGAAHVGVLKCLEELNIPIDMITGTSMGGLVGGLYSMGYSADYLDSLLRSIDWKVMMSDKLDKRHTSYLDKKYKEKYVLSLPFYYEEEQWKNRLVEPVLPSVKKTSFQFGLPDGYLYGLNVNNMLSSLTVGYQDSLSFANLPIPYFCVAADMVSKKEKNWTKGSLVLAMRSTMSIPFLFKPVRHKGMVLIDGGTRNNMPVDIAKAMGADIVIAVDLSQESATNKNVNTVVDMVMQTVGMMGADAYNQNINDIDVYLHPNMDGYGMLSFSTESIADIILRGYLEAKEHYAQLYEVAQKTHATGTILSGPRAVDLGQTSIKFESVDFVGLSEGEKEFFRNRLRFDLSKSYNKKDLEAAVSVIYATGCYENVAYRVSGNDPYHLEFLCRRGPVHRVGIGARGDSEDLISVAFNVGLWDNRLYGSIFNSSVKLGLNPSAEFEYAYRFSKGPKISFSFNTRYVDVDTRNQSYIDDRFDPKDDRHRMWANDFTLLVRTLKQPFLDAYGGVQAGNVPYYTFNNVRRRDWNFHYKALAHLTLDTRDDNYFTRKGFLFELDYNFVFGTTDFRQNGEIDAWDRGFDPYHIASIAISRSFPISDFSITATARGRYISRDNYDDVFFFDRNYAGGFVSGLFVPHHYSVNCFSGINEFDPIMIILGLDLRYRFLEKNFITFTASTINHAPTFKQLTYSTENNAFVYGFALHYGRKTIFGPLRLGVNWNSKLKRKVGFYVGIGYDF